MKNLKKRIKKTATGMAAAVLVLASCNDVNIGLGSAVDTETPQLNFSEAVPDNATVRGKFTISGNWSDDGEIGVSIRLLEITDGEESEVSQWELVESDVTVIKSKDGRNSGSWKSEIDTTQFTDSTKYKLEVTITDTYGHSSSKTKSFTIDNTPPVLVLTRPTTSRGEESYDSYGQEFIVKGYIGDACDKKDIEISVYDINDSSKPIYRTVKENINSTDFAITVAEKNSEDESLREAYAKIYEGGSGEKKLVFSVTAYDKAYDYSEADETKRKGNQTEYFYQYNALYSEVFEAYGVTDIYEMNRNRSGKSRSGETEETDEEQQKILKILEENRKEYGQFTINPANNPSFKISGKNPLKKDGSDFEEGNETYYITNGSTIVAEIDPGLDQTPLEADSLGLYVIEWDSEKRSIKEGAEKIPLYKPLVVKDEQENETDNPVISEEEKKARQSGMSSSGDTYKFKALLKHSDGGVQVGKKYIFGIYGYDQKGIKVENIEDTYGFLFSTTVSPTIKISEPGLISYIKEGDSLTIKGTATTEIGVPEIRFSINGSTDRYHYGRVTKTTEKSSRLEHEYECEIEAEVLAGLVKEGAGEFEIEGEAEYCGLSGNAQINVVYDNEGPEIEITSPGEDDWQNEAGSVKVSGKISDAISSVEKIYYSTTSTDISESEGWKEFRPEGITFRDVELVKTEKQGKACAQISFYATDKAGNVSAVLTRKINVDFEKPVLEGLGYTIDGKSEAAESGESVISGKTEYTIGGRYSDSGTEVSVKATRDGKEVSVIQEGKREGVWKIEEKDVEEGVHTYEIQAEDESGKTAVNRITVTADRTKPEATLSAMPGKEDTKVSSFTFTGTAGDATSGIEKIELTVTDAADTAKTKTVTVTGTENWSEKVTYAGFGNVFKDEGEKKVTVTVTDRAGNVLTTPAQSFTYDSADPELNVSEGSVQDYMPETGYTISGSAGDTYRLGSLNIYETRNSSGVTGETASESSEIEIAEDGSWSVKVPLNGGTVSEGTYKYYLVLSDEAGHEVKSKIYTSMVDTTAPTVEVTSPSEGGNLGINAISETNYKIQGSFGNDTSGIAAVWYSIGNAEPETPAMEKSLVPAEWEETGWTKSTAGTSGWSSYETFRVKGSDGAGYEEGSYIIYVHAVDKAGNISETVSVSFDVDLSEPELEVSDTSEEITNKAFTISGSVKDTNGVKGLYITDSLNGDSKWQPEVDEEGRWTVTFEPGEGENQLKDGNHILTIEAEDKAGKKSRVTKKVVADTAAPVTEQVQFGTTALYADVTTYSTLTAVIKDATSGVDGAYYQMVTDNLAPQAEDGNWADLNRGTGNSWKATVDFGGKKDGKYYAYVKAVDAVGNVTVTADGEGTEIVVDEKKPVASITGPVNAKSENAEFTVKVTDTNPLEPEIEVTVPQGGSAVEATVGSGRYYKEDGSETSAGNEVSYGEWKVTVPLTRRNGSDGRDVIADGQYTVTVRAKDENGRSADAVRQTVLRDTRPPAIQISTEAGYITGQSLKIEGTIEEENLRRAGAVLYKDGSATETETSLQPDRDGKWSWTIYEGIEEDAVYTVKVSAEDEAGQSSEAVSGNLTVDRTKPATTIGYGNEDGKKLYDGNGQTVSEVTFGETYYTNRSGAKIKGTITETNFDRQKVILRTTKDGAVITSPELGGMGKVWMFEPLTDSDGKYVYELTVTDNAGLVFKESLTVIVDKTAPQINNISLNNSALISEIPYTVNVKVLDSEIGVGKVLYSVNGNEPETDAEYDVSDSSWKIEIENISEGNRTLKVKALDILGNESAIQTRSFMYDKDLPELTENSGTASLVRNAITLSGTAGDSNRLESVVITDSLDQESRWVAEPDAEGKWNCQINLAEQADTLEANKLTDGKHVLTITAKDIAGRKTTVTREITVDQTKPVVGQGRFSTSPLYLDVTEYNTFTVIASDSTSGLDGVYYQIVTDNHAPQAANGNWKELNRGTGTNWTSTISLSDKKDGTYYVYVKAVDAAGNVTVTADEYGTALVIDEKKPVIAVTGAENAKSENVELTVKVTDTNPTAPSAIITVPQGGSAVEATVGSGKYYKADGSETIDGQEVSYGIWKITVPFEKVAGADGTDLLKDGTYSIRVSAEDKNGRRTDAVNHTVLRDTKPPAIQISTEAGYLTGQSLPFSGTITETHLKSAEAVLQMKNTSNNAWENVKVSGNAVSTTIQPAQDGSWNWTIYEGISADGEYKIQVSAEDYAGLTDLKESNVITIDRTAPSTTIGYGPGDGRLYDGNGQTVSEAAFGETYYTNRSGAKIKGTITETNFDRQKVILRTTKDGNIITSPELGGMGKVWMFEPLTDSDGKYVYELTVTDNAGLVFKESLTVIVDKTAPAITISYPSNDAAINMSTVSANGTVTEDGIGLKDNKIYYTTKENPSDGDWHSISYSGGNSWSQNLTLEDEGKVTLTLKTEDKLGNKNDDKSKKSVSFSYDKAAPTLTVASLGQYLNGGDEKTITVTGTASDSNGITKIEIKDVTTNKTYKYEFTDSTIVQGRTYAREVAAGTTPTVTAPTWSFVFKVGNGNSSDAMYLADGTHDLSIVLTDAAGRTSEKSVSFIVDTVAPVVVTPLPFPDKDETEKNAYKFIGEASDVTTQVKKVEVAFTDPALAVTKVNSASGTTTWTYNCTFANETKKDNTTKIFETSGKKTIYVRATDSAGNVSAWISKEFDYDTSAPAVTVDTLTETSTTSPADETLTSSYAYETTPKNAAGLSVNAGAVFKLDGTISDDWEFATTAITVTQKKDGGSEVSIPVTLTDETVASGVKKTWSITGLPRNPDDTTKTLAHASLTGSYEYVITVTDGVGKTDSKAFKSVIDVSAPEISLTQPTGNLGKTEYLSGSSYTFYGSANDVGNAGLSSWSYQFVKVPSANITSAATADSKTAAYNDSNWTDVPASNGNWSLKKTLGTASEALSEGKWMFYYKAVDTAGNESSPESISFWVDQNNPTLTASVTEGTTCVKGGTTNNPVYYFKTSVSGSVNGTIGATRDFPTIVDLSVQTTKEGETTFVSATIDNETGIWTIPASAFTEGTAQTITVTATDICGRTTSKTFTAYLDATAPSVEINKPGTNDAVESKTDYTAKGSVTENGVGFESSTVKYQINNGTWKEVSTVSGSSWNQKLDLSSTTQGQVTLKVQVTDKLGNVASTPASVQFYYDYEDPKAGFGTGTDSSKVFATPAQGQTPAATANLETYVKAGQSFTLKGYAYDTYKLSYITMTDSVTNQVYSTKNEKDSSGTARLSLYDSTTIDGATAAAPAKWSLTLAASDLAEGNHNFKLRAYDVSGRESDVETKTVFIDKTAPSVVSTAIPSTEQTEGASFKFYGTVKDGSNGATDSGIKEVKISFDNSTWIDAGSTTSWSTNVVFADYSGIFGTSGQKTIYVKAIDMAGNEGSASSTTFDYDTGDPAASVTKYTVSGTDTAVSENGSEFNVNTNFSLSGTVSDDWGFDTNAAVVITQQKVGGTAVEIGTIKASDLSSGNVWTITDLPRGDDKTSPISITEDSTGTYKYVITVKDKAGKTNEGTTTIKASIDKKKPTVALGSPSGNIDKANALSGSSYVFKGTITDEGPSGVAAYKYVFSRASTAPSTGWSEYIDTISSWNITKELCSGNSDTTKLYEGQWYLYVQAKDKAGNESEVKSLSFWVDQANPEVTCTITESASNAADKDCIKTDDDIYYFDKALTGVYTATDSSNVAPAVVFSVNGVTKTPAFDENDSSKWSLALADFKEGNNTLVLTATDQVGKTAKATFNVYKDTTAPVITVQSPAAGTIITTSSVTPQGTFTENGVGIVNDKFEYSTDGSTWNAIGFTGGTSWSKALTLTAQGDVTLSLRATDKLGNISSTVTRTFKYDTDIPEIKETDSVDQYVKAGFTLSGKIWDTYKPASIVIKDETTGKTYSNDSTKDENTTATVKTAAGGSDLSACKTEATAAVWNLSLAVTGANAIGEGNHKFVITGYDANGRESLQETKNVFVDTIAPSINGTVTMPTVVQTRNSTYRFTGKAIDNTNTAKDSKVAVVYLQFKDNATSKITEWLEATGTENWNYTLDFTDETAATTSGCSTIKAVFSTEGVKTVTVKIKDNAGNENASAYTNTFIYDKGLPTVSIDEYTLTGSSAVAITSTEFKINKEFQLKGTSSDSYGVQRIEVKQGDKLIAVIMGSDCASWTVSNLPRASTESITYSAATTTTTGVAGTSAVISGDYTYTVTAYDKTGVATNKAEATTKARIDTTPPTIKISKPESGITFSGDSSISGSTYTFKGTAADVGFGVQTIKYVISASSTLSGVTEAWTDGNTTAWEVKKILESGIGTSTTGLKEGHWYLYVKAVDEAGNETTDVATPSKEFYVDLASPVISAVKTGTTSLTAGSVYYYNSTETKVTLKGEITESHGIKTLKVGGETLTSSEYSLKTGETDVYEWTKQLDISANTELSVVVEVEDNAGRTDTKTYKLYRDTKAPEITISNPDSDVDGDNSLSSGTFNFRGTITDGSGSGISSYKYKFTKTTITDVKAEAKASDAESKGWKTASGESWTKAMTLKDGTTASDITDNQLNEGQWYLYIYAVDAVGLESTSARTFWVDKKLPEIETKYLDATSSHTEKTLANATAVTEQGEFTFKFTPSDANGLDSTEPYTITVLRDETALVRKDGDVSSNTGDYYITKSGSVYTVNIPTAAFADGLYTFTLTAKDSAGKVSNTVTRNIRKDTTGPVVSISSPEFTNNISDWQTSSSVRFVGSSDDVSGIRATYYKVGATAEVPAENAETDSSWTSNGWTKIGTTASWNFSLTNTAEATVLADSSENKINIASIDGIGNVSTVQTFTVKYDGNNPEIQTGSAKITTNKTFSLTGTAWDTTGLSEVRVSYREGGTDKSEVITPDGASSATTSGTQVTWTKEFTVSSDRSGGAATGELSDGEYVFTITAVDAAGRTTSSSDYTVLVDTVIPGISSSVINLTSSSYVDVTAGSGESAVTTRWYKTTALPLVVTINSTTVGTNTAGISNVQYTTKSNPGDSDWSDFAGSGLNWGSTVAVSSGTTEFKIRAIDEAGNISAIESLTAHVDADNPSLPEFVSVKIGNDSAITTKPEDLTVNGTKNVELTVRATDSHSGVAKVTATIGNSEDIDSTTTDASGNYVITINKAKLVKGPVKITVTDNVGKTSFDTLFSFDLDNQAPTVTIDALRNDGTVNGRVDVNKTITISGTAKDNKALLTATETVKPVVVKYYYASPASTNAETGATIAPGADWTSSNTTIQTATLVPGSTNDYGTWSFDLDTSSVDNKYLFIQATATDAAGNSCTPVEYVVFVNQDTDRPIITFTNLELDGMTSSNFVYLSNTTKLYGIISDDDGIKVSENKYEFYYSTDYDVQTSKNPAEEPTWNQIELKNNSFTLDLPEGPNTIYFKVEDKGNTTYTSSASGGPKLVGSDAKTFATDTKLYMRVNTRTPEIKDVKFQRYDAWANNGNGAYEETENSQPKYVNFEDLSASYTFGGTRYTKVKVVLKASDANGVETVNVYKSSDYNNTTANHTPTALGTPSCKDTTHTDGSEYTWTITDVDLSSITESGSTGFTIVAKDYGDLEKTKTFDLTIDKTAPTLKVTSHSNGAGIRTTFTLKGSIDDANATMKYVITDSNTLANNYDWSSTNTAVKSYVIPTGSSISSWDITFDNDIHNSSEMHDKDQKTYFIDLYGAAGKLSDATNGLIKNPAGSIVTKDASGNATSNLYRTNKPFYFHFYLEDQLGNSRVDNTFYLSVDPQGDIPVISMNSPTATSYAYYNGDNTAETDKWYYQTPNDYKNNQALPNESGKTFANTHYKGAYTTASGRIVVTGYAEDDKTIKGLYMQIDPTYNPTVGFTWVGATDPVPAGGTSGKTLGDYYKNSEGQSLIEDFWANVTTKGSGAKYNKTGIYIGDSASWNIKLNTQGEFNGASAANNTIAIKLFAVDEDGNVYEPGSTDILLIEIDSGAPKIGESEEFTLWQYAWTTTDSEATIKTYYTNTDTPVASTTTAFVNSGCTGTAATITAVGANNASITVGGKVYSKNFVSRKYTDDMWLNGIWWLAGSVEDESGISEVKVGTVDIITNYCDEKEYIVDSSSQTKGWKDYRVRYPIGKTTGYGTDTFTLNIKDNAEQDSDKRENSRTFTVNYDNQKPTLSTAADASYNIAADVVNTDGFYTISSAVTEANGESGFARTVVYFKRTASGYENVYDVFLDKGSSPIAYSGLVEEDCMYWKTGNVTAISNNESSGTSVLTVTTNDNVHKGGIVKFGGTVYTIKDKTASSITIDGTPSSSLANTSILFGIGAVIDRKGTEGTTNTSTKISSGEGKGYWTNISGDDDFMVERVTTQGTKTVWEGNINTKNIPDGPIEIHYVVYDQAGNSAHGVVGKDASTNYATADYKVSNDNVSVANNAPMIASVTVATTFTGGDEPEYEETWYVSEKTRKVNIGTDESPVYAERSKSVGVRKDVVVAGNETGTTAFMTIKDKSWVKPEIVGGNGALSYTYKIDDGTESDSTNLADATVEGGEEYLNATDQNENKYVSGQVLTFPITTAMLDTITTNSTTAAPTTFLYTISDSTEGVAGGLKATATVLLALNHNDTSVPKVAIDPFEWNGTGTSDYSVRENGQTVVYCTYPNNNLYEGSTENGHIEVEKYLPTTFKATGAANNLMDRDPKVSGKISIRGYAYDDIRLSKLWIKMDSFTFTGKTASTETGTSGYIEAASFDASTKIWTGSGDFDTNGWRFTVLASDGDFQTLPSDTTSADYRKKHSNNLGAYYGSYFNKEGHKVYWQLDLNTEKLTGVAGLNKKLTVLAEAEKGGATYKYSSATSKVETGADNVKNVPFYQMDVVPYITGVDTLLSDKDKTIKGSFSRTSSGKYAVSSAESVGFKGFNITGGTAVFTSESTGVTATSGKYAIPSTARSGNVKVVVNSVDSINNINDNDAGSVGSKTISVSSSYSDMSNYAYNRKPNNVTNNRLTDDVYFDIWELDGSAASSGSSMRDPVMHINPNTDQIGFGYVRGSDSVSFPANGQSYTWYQKNRKDYKLTNFVYDSAGVAHNVSIGLDAQFDTGIAGRMLYNNSNWYAGNDGESYIKQWDMRYSISLESIGIPNNVYLNGTKVNETGGKGIIDIDRFAQPKIAAAKHGTTGTGVYIMYYDTRHKQIRFRYGEVPNSGANRTSTQYGLLDDASCENYNGNTSTTTISSDTSNKNDTWAAHDMFEAAKANYALIAGDYYRQTNDGKTGTVGTKIISTGNTGSEFYDISVVPSTTLGDDKVVMIWYDLSAKKLMYMYRENLVQNNTTKKDNTDASSSGVANKWSTPKAIWSNKIFQDCAITVDKNNGIHIAAYEQNNEDLVYAYLPTYNHLDTSGNTPYTCIVDAYSKIGTKLTIDTALKDFTVGQTTVTRVVPYISYCAEGMSSLPKYAYLVNGIDDTSDTTIKATVVDGSDGSTNLFSGAWEVTMIPTSSVMMAYNINVAVWKNSSNGKIKTSPTRVTTAGNTQNYTDFDVKQRKYTGNGISDVVLGYQIKRDGIDYIETAMRR